MARRTIIDPKIPRKVAHKEVVAALHEIKAYLNVRTWKEVADVIGVSLSSLESWLYRNKIPRTVTLYQIYTRIPKKSQFVDDSLVNVFDEGLFDVLRPLYNAISISGSSHKMYRFLMVVASRIMTWADEDYGEKVLISHKMTYSEKTPEVFVTLAPVMSPGKELIFRLYVKPSAEFVMADIAICEGGSVIERSSGVLLDRVWETAHKKISTFINVLEIRGKERTVVDNHIARRKEDAWNRTTNSQKL